VLSVAGDLLTEDTEKAEAGHRLSSRFEELKHLIQDTGRQRNGQLSHFSQHCLPVTIPSPSFTIASNQQYQQGMA